MTIWQRAGLGQLARLDREAGRAKGAIDADQPVLANHRLAFFRRKTCDDRTDIVGIAAAAAAELDASKGAHFLLLVEQPPDQIIQRKPWIRQLLRFHRSAHDGDMRPVRMVEPRMQSLTALFALGKMLKQEAAGGPMSVPLL